MRRLQWALVLSTALTLAGCSGNLEYIPAASLLVGRAGGNTTLELKLDTDDSWDRVSRCVWKIDGVQNEHEGRWLSIVLDREVPHSIGYSLYIGENFWCSFKGHCPEVVGSEGEGGGVGIRVESVVIS